MGKTRLSVVENNQVRGGPNKNDGDKKMETSPSPAALPHKIGFIGGGQMALALAKGFMASGLISPGQVLASAPSDSNLMLWRQLNAETTHVNAELVRKCDVIFLAVKPNIFPMVMRGLRDSVSNTKESKDASGLLTTDSKLFVSIMAGIKMETLTGNLKTVVGSPRVIRVHPNTPAMVGAGCAVFSLGEGSNCEDAELVRQLFTSVGVCELVPESQQDAFTGMAGSGPAYIYTIIEALSDGGVRMGMPRALATKFAAQMAMGAAKMVLESGKHTGQLKDEVTSPGGTTIRAIQVMERAGIRGIMMDAVQASAERAEELGQK